jgi:broad specificity phosphatase PhoE
MELLLQRIVAVLLPLLASAAAPAGVLSKLPPLADGKRRLYLCRHGETDYNTEGRIQGRHIDRPLNDVGLAQARALGDCLSGVALDYLVCSPLRRARETADAVDAAQRQPFVVRRVCAGVVEMGFGALEGKQRSDPGFAEVTRAWDAGETDRAWPGEGGESADGVAARALAALDELGVRGGAASDGGGDDDGEPATGCAPRGARHIAIVAHGRFNKILLAALLRRGDLRGCSEIEQGNCCINVLDFDMRDADDVREVALNFRDHWPAAAV